MRHELYVTAQRYLARGLPAREIGSRPHPEAILAHRMGRAREEAERGPAPTGPEPAPPAAATTSDPTSDRSHEHPIERSSFCFAAVRPTVVDCLIGPRQPPVSCMRA